MPEIWCPIAEVVAEFYGTGDSVEDLKEYSQVGHCKGCTRYPSREKLLYLSILTGNNQVEECMQTSTDN